MTSYIVKNNYDQVRSMFTPLPYIFDYKNKDIQCRYCKSKFDYTKLKDGEDEFDRECYECGGEDIGYDYIENICPYCDMFDCCKVEYEDFCYSMVKD